MDLRVRLPYSPIKRRPRHFGFTIGQRWRLSMAYLLNGDDVGYALDKDNMGNIYITGYSANRLERS